MREPGGTLDPCLVVDLGRRGYEESWRLQQLLVERRKLEQIGDVLLFVEHPPTYTIGRNGDEAHLLDSQSFLAARGIQFVRSDRGGDITFHGPGQLVGYPIMNLKRWRTDVHAYLRQLEEVMIRTVAEFGIDAHREDGMTGIWHADGKIGAIGVRLSRWVSSHGFALNVTTDLDYFNRIVPCGIVGRGVSSMGSILSRPIPLQSVRDALTIHFGDCFSRSMELVTEERLAS